MTMPNSSNASYHQRRVTRPIQHVRSLLVMVPMWMAVMCGVLLPVQQLHPTTSIQSVVEAFSMVTTVGKQHVSWTVADSAKRSVKSSASSLLFMSSITSPSNEQNEQQQQSLRRDMAETTTTTANSNQMESNGYMTNMIQPSRWMELPASSPLLPILRQNHRDSPPPQTELLLTMEQSIGRIAMMGAIGILIRECYDGQSIVEQVMHTLVV